MAPNALKRTQTPFHSKNNYSSLHNFVKPYNFLRLCGAGECDVCHALYSRFALSLQIMGRTISNDLKYRIVLTYEVDHLTMEEIATKQRVSIGLVSKVVRLHRL